MSDNWFYEFNGKPTGPVSINELMRILSGHESPKDILVWGHGFTIWQRAGTVPALNAEFARSPKLPEAPFYSSSPSWRGYMRFGYPRGRAALSASLEYFTPA
jgi:hypothetical protein